VSLTLKDKRSGRLRQQKTVRNKDTANHVFCKLRGGELDIKVYLRKSILEIILAARTKKLTMLESIIM